MLIEVEFLFDNQLIAAVEKLIRDAKKSLLLVSPYIDLDARIIDALNEKKEIPDFELDILFGKNENNYSKSIKKDSLELFKKFPNVEIRYNERLHAKFYQNDFEFIMTSLNLYDYSLANNIEVGVKGEYASKGILRKAVDFTGGMLIQGIDKVKHDVFGMEEGIHPIDKFKIIFENSDLKFKTEPIIEEKSRLHALISKKKLQGFEIVVNEFDKISPVIEKKSEPAETVTTTITNTTQTVITQTRCISASQVGRNLKLQARDITILMEKKGYIKDDKITESGKSIGLILKSYMGNEYIAYPENLEEFKKV
jgi:PLD-like domain